MPPSMSNTPGPGRDAVGDVERPRRQRAHREDGVVVPEDQDLRVATARPVHVRAGDTRDQFARSAEVAFDHRGEHRSRRVQGVEVERRRLDLDERRQVGEHGIEVEHVGRDQLDHLVRLRPAGGCVRCSGRWGHVVWAGIVTVALVAAACSSGDDATPSDDTAATTATDRRPTIADTAPTTTDASSRRRADRRPSPTPRARRCSCRSTSRSTRRSAPVSSRSRSSMRRRAPSSCSSPMTTSTRRSLPVQPTNTVRWSSATSTPMSTTESATATC